MRKGTKGFTLIELMIAVAIIAILAIVAIPNFVYYRNLARVAAAVGTCESIRTAMASYATSGDLWDYDNIDPYFGEYAVFFVGEVGMEIEFNLVKFFRLAMFGNYRWTPVLNMKPMYGLEEPSPEGYRVSGNALNGWSAGVRFKFGSF